MEHLAHYRPTPMESFIVDFYRGNHVKSPQDIDLELFAYEAGIWIHYSSMPSTHYEMDNSMYSIVIDDRGPWQQQRVELAHEIGHCILHVGNQSYISQQMRVVQEAQADRFAFYALTPTFMIANCLVHAFNRDQLVSQLAYDFDVPEPFMDVRLALLEERMRTLSAQQQMAAALAQAASGYDYSYRHPGNPNIELLVRDGVIIGQRRRAAI